MTTGNEIKQKARKERRRKNEVIYGKNDVCCIICTCVDMIWIDMIPKKYMIMVCC